MPASTRQYVTKPARLFKHPATYARIDLGSEAELRQLGRSYLARPLYPVIADAATLEVYDGNRRIAAVMQEDPAAEVPACLIDEPWSDSVKLEIQMESAATTRGLSDFEHYAGCSAWLELNPAATAKDLAGRIHRDEGVVSKLLSLGRCIEAVQDAARAGRIGYTLWHQLSKLPPQEQLAALAAGATRDQLQQRRRNGNGNGHSDREKVPSVRITLPDEVTVTIRGKDLNLTRSADALRTATKEVEFARTQHLSAKAAQAAWKDRAAKPKAKDAEPESIHGKDS